MNGYDTTGFTQSLNGIVSISDGNGTTIENGQISTGDITGEDIISDSLTTSSLKTTSLELTGDLTIDGTLFVTTIDSTDTNVVLFPSAGGITIGSTESTITNIQAYLECDELALFKKGISASEPSTLYGITNDLYVLQNNLATDCSSLFSTASTILNGGLIVKKNIYATNVMTDHVATGNIGCGNLNSSNDVNCVKLKSTDVICKSVIADDVFYKTKICGYINLGVAPYLKIPLTTSLLDTTTDITNFNISTYLTNANNNSIFLLPLYSVIFYNGNNILFVANNSEGTNPLYYSTINFNQDLICTKILIQYKNLVIL